MHTSLLRACLLALVALFGLAGSSYGQGVTTSAMNGVVLDQNGAPAAGATVRAVHTPTGALYGAVANETGRFLLLNLKPGGPYEVTVTLVGFKDYKQAGINLALGQNLELKINIQEEAVELEGVEIVALNDPVLNSKRTGAATNINSQQIASLPTIQRSLQDFTRLTPQSNRSSFAGSNNRYNNISVDGSILNDVFGLSGTGTPGGQTGVQPISFDAIEEIQVSIAPYDVRQGQFTGAGINIITRGGTNEISGSVYGFFSNQDLRGRLPGFFDSDPYTKVQDFNSYQYGFRIGGPIIKNRLFYFVSGEQTREEFPYRNNIGDPNRVGVTEADVFYVDTAAARYGYQTGGFGPISEEVNSDKILLRLDFNLNENNKFTLRHNWVYGQNLNDGIGRGERTISGNFAGIDFPSVTNSTVFKWNAVFGSKWSSELNVNYTSVSDNRNPQGTPFPRVEIRNLNNVDGSGTNNGNRITIGSENFSVANRLRQDIASVTYNLTYFQGRHTIVGGLHAEYLEFKNLFIRDFYGTYIFNSLADFSAGRPSTAAGAYNISYANPAIFSSPSDLFEAEFSAVQVGLYVQDQYAVSDKLNITLGVRADIVELPDSPRNNPTFESQANDSLILNRPGLRTSEVPGTKVLWSPRLGINYDLFGDRSTQLRGGIGLFTGRVPFVWISNQYGNTGVEIIRISSPANTGANAFTPTNYFSPNAFNQPIADDFIITSTGQPFSAQSSEINLTDQDFTYPQLLRISGGVDQKLPFGLVLSVDALIGKTINNITYEDLTLNSSGAVPFGVEAGATGGDQRPLFPSSRLSSTFTNVLLLKNTSRGFTFNGTVEIRKPFSNGWTASVAYSYGRAQTINDGTSSQAVSNWRFQENVYGANNVGLNTADFETPHRIVASGTYRKEFAKNFAFEFSGVYIGQSGTRLSYVYDDNINRDDQSGTNANDLVFIPADITQVNFVPFTNGSGVFFDEQAQFDALMEFVDNDSYLKTRKGKYAERNEGSTPFEHQVDVRGLFEVYTELFGKRRTIQFTCDIQNFLGLLNTNWGRQWSNSFGTVELIDFLGSYSAGNIPNLRFDPAANPFERTNRGYGVSSAANWRMQLGLRISF